MRFLKKDYDERLHSVQKLMQKHALGLAADNGIILDYSLGSFKELDKLTTKISLDLKAEGLDSSEKIQVNESASGIAECLGCYIVECLERAGINGKWAEDPSSAWPGYQFDEKTIYPLDWIMKKLIDTQDLIAPKATFFLQ